MSSAGIFRVVRRDRSTAARAGILRTARGVIRTPVFMPVGTHATVKTVTPGELKRAGAQIILSNAYHLHLRPGEDLIGDLGGLHRFMGWDGPILTDSGGYQIFSLGEPKELSDEGLTFKSHLDGSLHKLTPAQVIGIQQKLGVDIMMPLDECPPYPASREQIERAVDRTRVWLKESVDAWKRLKRPHGHLFGIVQGGVFEDLRARAAREVDAMETPGIAIGGLSVGEPRHLLGKALSAAVEVIQPKKPRYLMGVGYPEDLFIGVERGVDMFDCVVPTRNGRNGTVFTSRGRLILRNAAFRRDRGPMDPKCPCEACQKYSLAYLRHLFMAREMLGLRLASLHNLTFFIKLLDDMRRSILDGRFLRFKNAFFENYRSDNNK
ncbi:MAG: tRNA guanosine(34) transglycosylase Tgt [Candidatus Omnitrophica bacterium]|nr:tRNA guanosine(34) transglycosylase Tgt [Candidatus Omnitrophota bacterium]